MSKYFAGLMVIGLMFSAAESAAAADLKIAVVSFQQALNEVEQGKTAKASLKAEFDAKQKKLDLQQDELKKMREDLDKQRLVLSQEALRTKEEGFNKKFMDLQKNFGDYRQQIAEKEARITTQILKNLRGICEDLGKKEGYTLIVENSQDAVLYAAAKDDLTVRVIKIYNDKFKGPIKVD